MTDTTQQPPTEQPSDNAPASYAAPRKAAAASEDEPTRTRRRTLWTIMAVVLFLGLLVLVGVIIPTIRMQGDVAYGAYTEHWLKLRTTPLPLLNPRSGARLWPPPGDGYFLSLPGRRLYILTQHGNDWDVFGLRIPRPESAAPLAGENHWFVGGGTIVRLEWFPVGAMESLQDWKKQLSLGASSAKFPAELEDLMDRPLMAYHRIMALLEHGRRDEAVAVYERHRDAIAAAEDYDGDEFVRLIEMDLALTEGDWAEARRHQEWIEGSLFRYGGGPIGPTPPSWDDVTEHLLKLPQDGWRRALTNPMSTGGRLYETQQMAAWLAIVARLRGTTDDSVNYIEAVWHAADRGTVWLNTASWRHRLTAERIAIRLLEDLYLNVDAAEDELRQGWETVRRMTSMPRLDLSDATLPSLTVGRWENEQRVGNPEEIAHDRVYATQSRMIALAWLAKHHRAVHGAWPDVSLDPAAIEWDLEGWSDFADPFSATGQSLLWKTDSAGDLVIYSRGPDGVDTGGTPLVRGFEISPLDHLGDIGLKIPAAPTARFPHEEAAPIIDPNSGSAALPEFSIRDPYSSDDTIEVAIWEESVWARSNGPDHEPTDWDLEYDGPPKLELIYDPTNGARDPTDLWASFPQAATVVAP